MSLSKSRSFTTSSSSDDRSGQATSVRREFRGF